MSFTNTRQALAEGQTIQWYSVESVLGRGGFGITYLATDNNLDHRVAIKEYLPADLVQRDEDKSLQPVSAEADGQFRDGLQRFLSEARTLVKFRHPNIVRVMAVFEANNTAYLVMEYEEGEQFKESVSKAGGADELELKRLIVDIIDGLEQVHQHGFIHRDIKPVNLIVRKNGSPVLIDFGATRVADQEGESGHTSFVTVGYTPLEQYQDGDGLVVGPWTDIYALGATLYYAISGETPVSAVSRLAALVNKYPDPLVAATEVGHGKYSEEFLEAIDWALQFKIADRPQNLQQWRQAIQQVPQPRVRKQGRSSRARIPGKAVERGSGKSVNKLWIAALAAVILLFIGGLGFWYYLQQQQKNEVAALLQRADSAFASDAYFQTARPLYVEVLQSDPQNQNASLRLQAIDLRIQQQISENTDNRNFETAQKLIDAYASVDSDRAVAFELELQQQKRASTIDGSLQQAEQKIAARNFQAALQQLSVLRQEGAADARLERLEERAQAAIKQQELAQSRLQNEERERESARRLSEQRLAQANARQRQRRQDYRAYLDYANHALGNDDVAKARKWFDSAKAMQVNDEELANLEARLQAAEKFLNEPLTGYEISYARGQFSALKRAIEVQNLAAINELVSPESKKVRLFETLFRRYKQIEIQILNVSAEVNPKRVTATLRIEKLALPNGNVVYPSESYRDSELIITRQRYSWAAIEW